MLALCSFVAASFAALPQSGVDLAPEPSVKAVRSDGPAAELPAVAPFDARADVARDEHERAVCGRAPFVWDQVVVELGASVDLELARLLLQRPHLAVEQNLFPRAGVFLVRITDGRRVPAVLEELRALPFVKSAAPDAFTTVRGAASTASSAPNDALFGVQWNLANTGQSGGTYGADIGALDAWQRGTGTKDFAIGVVDGGVAINHPDLAPNRWGNTSELFGAIGVDDDANGYVDDRFGWDVLGGDGVLPADTHGSHVSGILGARGGNGIGVSGVNQVTSVVHVAATGSTSTAIAGYAYVTRLREDFLASGGTLGANVVVTNTSFGIDSANCSAPSFRVWNTVFDAMGELGILSVVATTNLDVDVDLVGDVPSSCTSPWLIAVCATDRNDARAPSGYGAVSIDLGAPGSEVRSCNGTNGWVDLSGTSMAAPHVSGAVAWLHGVASQEFEDAFLAEPASAALELRGVLLDAVQVLPSLTGRTASGGRLDLAAAGDAIAVFDPPDPSAPIAIANVAPKVLEAVRVDVPTKVLLTGHGFLGVQRVELDGKDLTAFPPQYTVDSDSQLRVGVDNGFAIGQHTIELFHTSGSVVANFSVVANSTLRVDLVASEPTFVLQAYGVHVDVGAPLDHFVFLVFSFSPGPSVLPGLVQLDLGNAFSDVWVMWSGLVDPLSGAHHFASGPLGQFTLGTKIYFQAASYSLLAPAFPLFVSNRQTGTLLF
jgi:subtilisin family serine protease